MNTNIKEDFFLSDNFLLQLRCAHHGVDGWLVHYPIGLNLAQEFHGILTEEGSQRMFVFFIEWDDPNLQDKVLTAYSAEITNSESGGSSLLLEWLQVASNPTGLVTCYKGSEVLCNAPRQDFIHKARKHFLKD